MNTGSGSYNHTPAPFNPPIRHQTSTNFSNGFLDAEAGNNPKQRGGLASNPGIGNLLNSNSGANFSNVQSISAADQKAFAAQAGGLPPLFIGFLTNDVSMKHV